MPAAKKTTRVVPISKFKAKCLKLLDQVNKTKTPLRITKRGRPIADVFPPSPDTNRYKLDSMAGCMEILGDIVSPVIDTRDIEALQD